MLRILPFFLLILMLAGCGGGGSITSDLGGSGGSTAVAATPTPTPTATPAPSPSPSSSPTPGPTPTTVSIAVTPTGASMHDVSDTLQMKAVATRSDGTTLDVTAAVTWSAPGATITAGGLLSGSGTPGTAVVTASLGGVSGSVNVTLREALYILDATLGKVLRVDDMAGGGLVQLTPSTPFDGPLNLAVDPRGRILVGEAGTTFQIVQMPGIADGQVRSYPSGGQIVPVGIATDAQSRIYWTDGTVNPRTVDRIDDIAGSGLLSFNAPAFGVPYGIFVDSGNHIYITDQNQNLYEMDDMAGTNLRTYNAAGFNFPDAVWVDAAGRIYVSDLNNQRIVRMDDINGTNLQQLNLGSIGASSMAVDAAGRIYYTQQTLAGFDLTRVDDITGANPTVLTGTPSTAPQFIYVR